MAKYNCMAQKKLNWSHAWLNVKLNVVHEKLLQWQGLDTRDSCAWQIAIYAAIGRSNSPRPCVFRRARTPAPEIPARLLAHHCEPTRKCLEPIGGDPTGSKRRETRLSSGHGGGGGNRTRVRRASTSRHHMLLPGSNSLEGTPPDRIPFGLARLPLVARRTGGIARPACWRDAPPE